MEEEKENKAKETISELQTFMNEIEIIGEHNETMSKEIETQKGVNKNLKEEVTHVLEMYVHVMTENAAAMLVVKLVFTQSIFSSRSELMVLSQPSLRARAI